MNEKSARLLTSRKKRQSIVTIAQTIAMLSIALFAFSLIVFVLISRHSEQKQRTKQMRASYVSLQKDITRREVERVVASINERRGNSRQIAMTKAKDRVYQAYAIAENIYKTFKDTKSQSEVLEIILSALRPVRFDQGGYYFVDTLDGRILLIAGRHDIEGAHYSTFASKNEQAVVASLIDIAKRKGEGIFEYKWTMPGKQGSGYHKISYLKLFKPYNLIIGTGLYLEDVEAVIKRELMEEITNIRYGNNGYFFINDFRGNVLAHGYQPDMVGASNWDYTDSRGNKLFQDLRKVIQNPEGGFCYYWWRMPETGKERPKIAFAKAVPEWKWLIGTGVYLDEVEANIKTMQIQLKNESIREISLILFVTIAIIILVYVIMGVLFRPLRRDIGFFNECFALAAQQNVSIDEEKIQFTELLKIAENANVMLREKEQFLQKLHDDKEEMKRLETRLFQAQKMESIGNLAGGIAHDFNNILFPIIGMSEMLLDDLPPDSLEWKNTQVIFKAGKRGSELVKQILAFSRQDKHQLAPIRLQFVMKEVLKLSRSSIPTNIEISQHLQQDCGLVLADSTQLHQIGMNLITNAYHAVQNTDGKINVEVRELTINDEINELKLPPGKYVTLKVEDNGTGIKKEHLDNIFEPYFTTKEQGKGTGLGLAVVYGIVKEYKGDISVKSEQGKGTCFQICLPVIASLNEADVAKKHIHLETGDENILLVDDELSVLMLEKQILERLGYKVDERSSSPEALKAFNANPDVYDLVVTDMSMPNLTGEKLSRELLSIRPDIPIIICTGFSGRFNKENAKNIGIKDFLMKPVVKSDMAQIVRKVLDEAKIYKGN